MIRSAGGGPGRLTGRRRLIGGPPRPRCSSKAVKRVQGDRRRFSRIGSRRRRAKRVRPARPGRGRRAPGPGLARAGRRRGPGAPGRGRPGLSPLRPADGRADDGHDGDVPVPTRLAGPASLPDHPAPRGARRSGRDRPAPAGPRGGHHRRRRAPVGLHRALSADPRTAHPGHPVRLSVGHLQRALRPDLGAAARDGGVGPGGRAIPHLLASELPDRASPPVPGRLPGLRRGPAAPVEGGHRGAARQAGGHALLAVRDRRRRARGRGQAGRL
jgi:hypothetical protein